MRRRRYKRLSMAHVYRACRYIFTGIAVYGIYFGFHVANISEGFVKVPEIIADVAFVTSMMCSILGMIGMRRYKKLERKYIQEQRKEENRALRRCA